MSQEEDTTWPALQRKWRGEDLKGDGMTEPNRAFSSCYCLTSGRLMAAIFRP
jgi:hypothetical protein